MTTHPYAYEQAAINRATRERRNAKIRKLLSEGELCAKDIAKRMGCSVEVVRSVAVSMRESNPC